MSQSDPSHVPAPPETLRATPAALARELEPLFDRVVETFRVHFDTLDHRLDLIGQALERNARDNKLLFDELTSLKHAIHEHAKRLNALEKIPRLPVRIQTKKGKRSGARKR